MPQGNLFAISVCLWVFKKDKRKAEFRVSDLKKKRKLAENREDPHGWKAVNTKFDQAVSLALQFLDEGAAIGGDPREGAGGDVPRSSDA